MCAARVRVWRDAFRQVIRRRVPMARKRRLPARVPRMFKLTRRLVRLTPARRSRFVARLGRRVLHEDHGGEVLEYVLIAGLIVVASIATIQCVGIKVFGRWLSVNSGV